MKERFCVKKNDGKVQPCLNPSEGESTNVQPNPSDGYVYGTATTSPPKINNPVSQPLAATSEANGTVIKPNTGTNAIKYASITTRSWASFIDGLIIGGVSLLFNFPIYIAQFKAMFNSMSSGETLQASDITNAPVKPLFTILSYVGFFIGIFYAVYFIGKKGATPGKMLMKIKVIDKETGQAPGYFKAFLREIVGKFISSIILFIGYIWAVWDKEKQTWHDKIVGTIVINNK